MREIIDKDGKHFYINPSDVIAITPGRLYREDENMTSLIYLRNHEYVLQISLASTVIKQLLFDYDIL